MDDNCLTDVETIWVGVARRLGVEPTTLLSVIAAEALRAGGFGGQPPGHNSESCGLSVQEVAQRLGVSADLVRDEIAAGRIVARRIGRRVLIPSSEVDRILLRGGGVEGLRAKPVDR